MRLTCSIVCGLLPTILDHIRQRQFFHAFHKQYDSWLLCVLKREGDSNDCEGAPNEM